MVHVIELIILDHQLPSPSDLLEILIVFKKTLLIGKRKQQDDVLGHNMWQKRVAHGYTKLPMKCEKSYFFFRRGGGGWGE